MDQNLRYPLGFLLGNGSGSAPDHYRPVPFPAPLHVNPNAKFGRATNDRGAIIVLGEAIHPDHPELDHEGVARLLLDRFDDRQAHIDKLIGRFAVIAATADGDARVQTDAIGLRGIFFSREGDRVVAGSHAKMVAEAASPAPVTAVFLPSRWGYPGIDTPYAGVYRLPPNQELSLRTGRLHRFFPLEAIPRATIEEAWSLAFERAERAIDGLTRRGPVVVSLTAGQDTRTTLAAARSAWKRLTFFTYIRSAARQIVDLAVAKDIAGVLGLHHLTIDASSFRADPELLALVLENTVCSHIPPLACAFHERFGAHQVVHIRSNLLELGRSNLYEHGKSNRGRHAGRPNSPENMSLYYINRARLGETDHVLPAFERYVRETAFKDALAVANSWDLYFIEHRMGAWQGERVAETDIAFSTVIAFNSREIIRRIMGVPQWTRSKSTHLTDRLAQMLPELGDMPINPESYPTAASSEAMKIAQ